MFFSDLLALLASDIVTRLREYSGSMLTIV